MITLPRLLGLSLLGGSMWTSAILPIVLIQPRQDTTPTATTNTETSKPAFPRPNPDVSGKYHAGDGVTAPKLISSVPPQYSTEARKKRISGNSVVELVVRADGTPSNVHVAKSIAEDAKEKNRAAALTLDETAIEAVQQYRFEPATYEGKPVPIELRVIVNFRIR